MTATTILAGFLDDATLGADRFSWCRRGCWCLYMNITQRNRRKKKLDSLLMNLHAILLGLTFTGFYAFNPSVLRISIAGASTVLVPSTAGSATTDSAGFLERAALSACHCIGDRLSDGWQIN